MSNYNFARRSKINSASVYDHADNVIILSVGSAYPPLLPDITTEASNAAGDKRTEVMQYGPLMGLDEFRETIQAFVAEDDIICSKANILITNGAKHAADLLFRAFIDPGDRIIVSAPTYMTTLQCMRNHDVNFIAIPQDNEGMRTDILERRLATIKENGLPLPKLLFDIPDFHNPTGISLSLARRKKILELALEHNFVIVEDDPYRRLRFEGTSLPSIKSMDNNNSVVSLGTVSKILSPGLRIGWAIGDEEIIRRMAIQKSDGGTSPFNQRICNSLMRSNKLSEHIQELTNTMMVHRDEMIRSIDEFLPTFKVKKPLGGYFLWLELPSGMSGDALAQAALTCGVEITPGRLCFPEEDPGNFVRLSYSYVSPQEIREGIRRLAKACTILP
jgi:2-aminoadipate transaminase